MEYKNNNKRLLHVSNPSPSLLQSDEKCDRLNNTALSVVSDIMCQTNLTADVINDNDNVVYEPLLMPSKIKQFRKSGLSWKEAAVISGKSSVNGFISGLPNTNNGIQQELCCESYGRQSHENVLSQNIAPSNSQKKPETFVTQCNSHVTSYNSNVTMGVSSGKPVVCDVRRNNGMQQDLYPICNVKKVADRALSRKSELNVKCSSPPKCRSNVTQGVYYLLKEPVVDKQQQEWLATAKQCECITSLLQHSICNKAAAVKLINKATANVDKTDPNRHEGYSQCNICFKKLSDSNVSTRIKKTDANAWSDNLVYNFNQSDSGEKYNKITDARNVDHVNVWRLKRTISTESNKVVSVSALKYFNSNFTYIKKLERSCNKEKYTCV